MERGTCIFDEISKQIEQRGLLEKLDYIAELVKQKYGANIWFVEILGKRWSHIAGKGGDSLLPATQVQLSQRIGLVSDSLEEIPCRDEFITFLRQLVEGDE